MTVMYFDVEPVGLFCSRCILPSVVWYCWLVVRKGIWHLKMLLKLPQRPL